MGWTANGSLGTATSKTNGNDISMSPSSSVPAGDYIFVWSAWDNQNDNTTIGPLGPFSFGGYSTGSDLLYPSDSQGNRWWTLASGAMTSKHNRTHGSLFMCKLQTGLTTSDTITVHNLFPQDAKAISAQWFSLGAGETWVHYDLHWVGTNGADPPAMNIPAQWSSIPTQEYLILHCMSVEGPSTDTFTWDADYTPITFAGTTGGLVDSNQTITGGYRIATLATDTIDVAITSGTRDNAQFTVVLGFHTPLTEFPTTPILDDFNRTAENPLSFGGLWNGAAAASEGTNVNIATDGDEAYSPNSGVNAGQLWEEDFGLDCDMEVYCTMTNTPSAVGDWIHLHLRQRGSSNATVGSAIADGCSWARPRADLPQVFGPAVIRLVFFGYVALGWFGDAVDGTKMGQHYHRSGRIISTWLDEGAGWYEVACHYDTWVEDAVHDPPIRIGLNMRQALVRADDFGGGCAVIERRHPQIYRWIKGRRQDHT